MLPLITRLATQEDGQTAVEYAAVLMLVVIVMALAFGAGLTGALDNVATQVVNALS